MKTHQGYSGLIEYRQKWPFGQIVERLPDQRLGAGDVMTCILSRAAAEPPFRQEVFANPRMVWAIALEEGLDIRAEDFLDAIESVNLHQETPTRLFLRLPDCHRGCQAHDVTPAPESVPAGKCHVCGKKISEDSSCSKLGFLASQPLTSRSEIEAKILSRAAAEPEFKQQLLSKPLRTYVQYARELASGSTPAYLVGVRRIDVFEETAKELHIVMPAGLVQH